MFELFQPDAHLSEQQRRAAAATCGAATRCRSSSAARPRRCACSAFCRRAPTPQALGIMDIASAQWTFDDIGRLNRIDLRLSAGIDVEAFRRALARRLPAGRAGRCAAGRARPRRHRDPRLPRQSQYAGAGGAVDRRLPGVLHAIAVGAAPPPLARAAAGAGRDARRTATRPDRRRRRTRRGRLAARRHSRPGRRRRHPAISHRRSGQRPTARRGRVAARRAAADARLLRHRHVVAELGALAAGAHRRAAAAGARAERRRRRLRRAARDSAYAGVALLALGAVLSRGCRRSADCRCSAMPRSPRCCSAPCCWCPR